MTTEDKFVKFWEELEEVQALLEKLGYKKEAKTVEKAILGMIWSTTKTGAG